MPETLSKTKNIITMTGLFYKYNIISVTQCILYKLSSKTWVWTLIGCV